MERLIAAVKARYADRSTDLTPYERALRGAERPAGVLANP
jgi:hypothetical protein